MNAEPILWILLILTVLSMVLVTILLARAPKDFDHAGKVRDELRTGREEANKAARELREEVTNGSKSATEALSGALTNLATFQQGQLDNVTKRLKELTESNQGSASERVRVAFAGDSAIVTYSG
jgi:gas vesicle protein